MIRSMTAFARVQQQLDAAHLCWELRSVNHRYLDVSFRLPESLRFLEPQLRNALKDRIFRGKIECHLKFQDAKIENQSMLIDMGTVNSLVELSAKLSASHCLANDLSVSQVLSWPGIIQVAQCDMEDLGQHVLTLFAQAIVELSAFRAQEGASLKQVIEMRLHNLSEEIDRAVLCAKEQSEASKEKFLNRLGAVAMELPEGRAEQEIAIMLARMDVAEELDRLTTHVEEVRRALTVAHSAGRRLDFLMQELNREANTLSSKSDSSELTQSAIEMKVLIEQMREQIQNIE